MEIVSNIALISINETVIAQLVSFLIFVYVINRIMFRPLRQTMSERENLIKNIKDTIETEKSELETISAEVKKQEATIKKDAFQVRKSLEMAAKEEAASVLATTGQELEAIKQQTEQDVANMIAAARSNLAEEAERLTITIMEKLLDRRLA